jgi:hypothetical protein
MQRNSTMRSIRVLAILGAVLGFTSATRADDDFLKPDNWEGLIDDYWTIKDGTVIGETKEQQKFNTFLCSKKKYKDFDMKFQIRLKGTDAANSGIQIRSQIVDMKTFAVGGPQADIGKGYWGSLYGERFDAKGKIGGGHMMKQAPADKVNEKLKKDDFNEYQIICKGKHVAITINGVTCVDQDFEIMPDEGIIAFQLHGGPPMQVTFKDIVFKELK